MRREKRAPGLLHLLCVALLLLPPAGRVLQHYTQQSRAPTAEDSLSLQHDLDRLREELRRAHAELKAARATPLESRYRTSMADVVPLSDPARDREVLWVAPRDLAAARDAAAALWQGHVVGRVIDIHDPPGLVRVQLLTDPAFQVRFRCGETVGMLRGSGERDPDGSPVLRVRYLYREGPMPAGEPVFTAGDDGVYPPGLRIGVVQAPSEGEVATRDRVRHPVVRADAFRGSYVAVQLVTDKLARSLGAVIRKENS